VRQEKPSRLDARTRRAAREAAVARTGDEARALIESWGDEAVTALNALSPAVGKKLSAFHTAGKLSNFPDPRDVPALSATFSPSA